MAKALKRINVSRIPELLRIAERVDATGEGCVLMRDDKDLAVVLPAASTTNRKVGGARTKKDLEAFLSAAGSWSDFDTDQLVADIYESRRSSRSPVDL
jgi:hypothetical protein